MLERLSNYIAREIKKADPDGPGDIEVLEYELNNRINIAAVCLLTFLFGWLLGHIIESLISMLSFAVARRFSGGFHMKSLTLCALVSSVLFAVIPLIDLNKNQFIFINVVTFLIFLCYAPNDFEELNKGTNLKKVKFYSLVFFIISLAFLMPVISISFFVQSLTILPLWNHWKGGRKINES
ncbi:accessory gene regulator ArgB-like protein [Paenibacillus maysiensis]|uniref:accessory gene regulator ArgB-like protein n=1 Tax=Paenibacillus maysiensis TaxID=1155954 RepID=UPI000472BF51|nr:accessory gene regulator B family protein [Paenibacillus maysiensis]